MINETLIKRIEDMIGKDDPVLTDRDKRAAVKTLRLIMFRDQRKKNEIIETKISNLNRLY